MANEFVHKIAQSASFWWRNEFKDADYLRVLQEKKFFDSLANQIPPHVLFVAVREIDSPIIKAINDPISKQKGDLTIYDSSSSVCQRLRKVYPPENTFVINMDYAKNQEPNNYYSLAVINYLLHLLPRKMITQMILASLYILRQGGSLTASTVTQSRFGNYETELVTPAIMEAIAQYNGLKPTLEIDSNSEAGTIYYLTK
jgi:hypothetical protein